MLKNPVTLAIYHSNFEANLAAQQLLTAGIEAEVLAGKDTRHSFQLPYPRNTSQAFQLRVNKDLYLKARTIIKR